MSNPEFKQPDTRTRDRRAWTYVPRFLARVGDVYRYGCGHFSLKRHANCTRDVPESTKTLANVVKVAQALDRRLQDGFWSDDIETSTMALLHAFRDVLDAQ
ncbi:hypothetical protein GQ600_5269 [Phytophthora cactorum]|nr:hypothetical protein GQ600_5269 [Phytophthora cactorum]